MKNNYQNYLYIACATVTIFTYKYIKSFATISLFVNLVLLFVATFSFKNSLRSKLLFAIFCTLASLIFVFPVDFNTLPIGDLGIYVRHSIINYAWSEGPWLSEPIIRLLMLPSTLTQNPNLFLFNSFLFLLCSFYLISKHISAHLHVSSSLLLLCLVCDRSLYTYESFWVLRQYLSTPLIILACLNFDNKKYILYLLLAFLAHNSSIIFFFCFLIAKTTIDQIKKISIIVMRLKLNKNNILKKIIILLSSTSLFAFLAFFFYSNKIDTLAANFTGDTLDSGIKTLILVLGLAVFSSYKLIESLFKSDISLEDKYITNLACIFFIPSIAYLFFSYGFAGAIGLLSYRISWFIYPVSGIIKLLGIYIVIYLLRLFPLKNTFKISLTLTTFLVLVRFGAHIQSIPVYFAPLKAFYQSTIL